MATIILILTVKSIVYFLNIKYFWERGAGGERERVKLAHCDVLHQSVFLECVLLHIQCIIKCTWKVDTYTFPSGRLHIGHVYM